MTMHVLLLTLALSSQAALAAPPAPAATADQVGQAYYLYLQGQMLDDRNDLSGAADKYKQALQILPDSAELRAELAAIYAEQGETEQAQQQAERAVAVAPGNRTANRVLGLVQASAAQQATPENVKRGLLSSAEGHLERVLADGARDPLVQITLGDLYVQTEDYPKAITTLKQFLLDRPNYAQAVMLLVRAYRGAGQADNAAALLDSYQRAAADTPAARLQAVTQLERNGDWQDAANAWMRILSDDPGNVPYRLRYATALVNAGDVESSRSVLEQVTRDQPGDISAWYLLSQVEARAGHLDLAEQAAQRLIALDGTDPRGPLSLADVREARGDFRGVVDVLEPRVVKASDADVASGAYAELTASLSSAWIALGEGKKAVDMLETAHHRAPTDRQIAFSLGAAYDQTHQMDRAEQAFRDIIAADPQSAPALNYLGYMLADHGRKLDEAVTLIQRALAVDAGNPSYLDSLGWAYYKQGSTRRRPTRSRRPRPPSRTRPSSRSISAISI